MRKSWMQIPPRTTAQSLCGSGSSPESPGGRDTLQDCCIGKIPGGVHTVGGPLSLASPCHHHHRHPCLEALAPKLQKVNVGKITCQHSCLRHLCPGTPQGAVGPQSEKAKQEC